MLLASTALQWATLPLLSICIFIPQISVFFLRIYLIIFEMNVSEIPMWCNDISFGWLPFGRRSTGTLSSSGLGCEGTIRLPYQKFKTGGIPFHVTSGYSPTYHSWDDIKKIRSFSLVYACKYPVKNDRDRLFWEILNCILGLCCISSISLNVWEQL
jgi:hypothetical protein